MRFFDNRLQQAKISLFDPQCAEVEDLAIFIDQAKAPFSRRLQSNAANAIVDFLSMFTNVQSVRLGRVAFRSYSYQP